MTAVRAGLRGRAGGAAAVRAPGPPPWLRRLGTAAWLVVGIALLLVGLFWALAATTEIVGPLVAGGIVATVTAPLVRKLERRRVPRALGSLVVLLGLIVAAAAIGLLVVRGIVSQGDTLAKHASAAADRIETALKESGAGAATSEDVRNALQSAVPHAVKVLANGAVAGAQSLTSLVIGVSFTCFAVFFLLKDGPALRRIVERNLGVAQPVGRVVVGRLVESVRGYFVGVTVVGAFNGVVVGVGAVILGVPLAATLGVVTFALAYVPFLGAFAAGAFAVLIALGAGGVDTAVGMLVVVLLANGLLQNLVSPFAMGAALGMSPLLNLAVTVGGGCLFGMFGLVLAAPLTAAALHVAEDIRKLSAPAVPDG